MKDEAKTKEQLISELMELRQRVAELKVGEVERKRAEEALRESEEKYKSLVEEAPIGIMNVDIKGKITYVNKTILQSTGYLREELVGKNAFRLGLVSRETMGVLGRRMKERLAGKPPSPLEIQFKCKDGKWIWLEIRGKALWEHGLPVGIQIIGQDITERKQVEEELRKRNDFIEAILDNLPIGLAVNTVDDGVARYLNKAFEKIYGWPKEDMVSVEEFFNCVYPDPVYRKELKEKILSDIASGDAARMKWENLIATGKDGKQRVINAENIPLLEQNIMISTVQDITERKQAEEREEKLQKELNLASRLASVGKLTAGVAHEINNPLTGILTFSERLLRKSTDKKVSRDLKRIYDEAKRAARVVEHLLTFARRREPKKENSDVNRILRRAVELRAYELKTSNIEVETDLAPGLPRVMADFYQIQEVFLNLIMNAEQAITEADRGGKLSIKTQQTKNSIRISFTDDGPGIPTEYLDRVFDPFFTTREKEGGTGLGLSVCHGIVQGHDGRIYARSKPGRGAIFVVELPLTGEKVKEAKQS